MFPRFARRSGQRTARFCWGGLIALGMILSPLPGVGAMPAHAFETHHDAGGSDDHHEKGEVPHESGPPLSFQTDLALWSFVTFIVFVFVLKTFAWGPLSSGLSARETRIRSDLDEAAAARREAEKLLAQHSAQISKTKDEIAEMIAEARRDADALKQDILTTAQKDAEATRNRAVEEINRARDAAVKELFDHTSRAVIDATAQILGRALNEADQDRLVEEALSQFAERN
ncbi:MAG: F0F1 ATP synthase subunit B [Planctomycetota bacterium]|nr:F0F1 ATP synthase subunit B [Planctomycetota bacterium]MDA1211974.1 F0F1 ATP synthase subunit B [Planctomycetota bacterium]